MQLFGIALSMLCGIIPMAIYATILTWFDRYEKEPVWLMLGVFLWGAIVAAGSALIVNTFLGLGLIFVMGSETLASFGTAVFVAPPVEETVKGLAVLGVFIYFYKEFDSLLDGVLYGSLVGFGFAASENVNYIASGFHEGGLSGLVLVAIIRVIVIGFLHATLTAFTGIGFAVARLNRGVIRFIAPVLGYGTAIFLHGFHNALASLGSLPICLLGSVLDWLGFVGMFVFILILVWREGHVMREHLQEEVTLGTLSAAQYRAACSVSGQFSARLGALGGGWRKTARFYDLCGELAFKKYQLARLGHERDLPQRIEQLRGEIVTLRRVEG